MFGVRPPYQRSGLGRRLMGEALAAPTPPRSRPTSGPPTPDNLPYYRSHGYEITGERRIPGGAPDLVHGAARRLMAAIGAISRLAA